MNVPPTCKRIMWLLILTTPVAAENIPVPNFSFEMPPVVRDEENPFGALPFLDDWDETAVGLADEFDQNTGVFLNTEPEELDHISNAHLDRLAFLSSLIGNAVRQELPVTFEPGRSYRLTVSVATSLTFIVGATEELEIAFFYFDGGVEQIIASNTVAGSAVNTNSLVNVSVAMPFVDAGDAWANQPIGVLIRPSVTDPDDVTGEGFWDVDNVRLEASDLLPVVSVWGMIVTTIMLASCGTILFRRWTPGTLLA